MYKSFACILKVSSLTNVKFTFLIFDRFFCNLISEYNQDYNMPKMLNHYPIQ